MYLLTCYSYKKATNHYHHHHHVLYNRRHHYHHHLYHRHHHRCCHHHHHYHHPILTTIIITIIIIIIIIIIRYKSFTNTRKNRKKEWQKNNDQNTVTGEHIRVDKENDISNASNSAKTDENKKDQNRNSEVKSVVIINDSMIRHLNGWDMSKKAHKSECKLYVKSFPGGKTSCMKDYVKPSLRSTPNHFILHVGTNDLNSNQTSGVIAKKIVDLALKE